jgi:DNA-binding HxlR family transcriptional regulator
METRAAVKSAPLSQLPLPTKCPLTAALNAIGGKWSLICLYWLDSGTRRFNELRRLTLRNLEHEGLICRTVYAEVLPRVEYCISSHGETVRPLIQAVRTWGREHLEWKQLTEDRPASPRSLPNSSKGSTRQKVVNLTHRWRRHRACTRIEGYSQVDEESVPSFR